jgi:hypothetical protein
LRYTLRWLTILLAVVILLFFRDAPGAIAILGLTLLVAMYLTVIELREMEPRPHWKWWAWWLSLVFLTHFIGYLVLRVYSAYRRRQSART